MKYNPTMVFTPAGIDACAYWRMWIPHISIPNSRFQFNAMQPDMNEIAEQDVLVVQRMFSQGNVQYLRLCREYGIKIIYDLDDNIWDMPKFNPAYNIFRRQEVRDGMINCAMWADVITVSTRQLQNVVQDEWSWLRNVASKKPIPVVHIDNVVDPVLFGRAPVTRDDSFVKIGWAGSNTHGGDIELVWSMLPSLLEKYENVLLEFVGHAAPASIRNHPRVKEREWVHISEFTKRFATWDWDIVLAPLHQHKFNRSKSSIKMQEAAAIHKPCLAENIAPYKYFASFTPELNWLLCDDYDWEKKLNELICNAPLRRELGEAMHENLIRHFHIDSRVSQWEEACRMAYSA